MDRISQKQPQYKMKTLNKILSIIIGLISLPFLLVFIAAYYARGILLDQEDNMKVRTLTVATIFSAPLSEEMFCFIGDNYEAFAAAKDAYENVDNITKETYNEQ